MASPPNRDEKKGDRRAKERSAEARGPDNSELMEEASALEAELARVKVLVDQYLLGVEKRHPAEHCRELKKRVVNLKTQNVRATAVRFRIDTIYQRFLTYDRLWERSFKELEEGTYRPDLQRLRLKNLRAKGAAAAANAVATPPPQREASPPAPQAAPSPPKSAPADAAAAQRAQFERIHRALIDAKRRCNESVEGITVDQVQRALRAQIRALREEGVRQVGFKVVIQNGRAELRAIPK